MKSLRVCASLAILLSIGTALAQEGTQDFDLQKLSSRSRANVRAELEQALAAGRLDMPGETFGSFGRADIASTRARTDVLAELEVARRARALDTRRCAVEYGGFAPGEIASARTREEVLAELTNDRAAGLSPSQRDRARR